MTDLRKYCMILYATYAGSVALQFFEATLWIGLLALIIGYFMTFFKKKAAKGTAFASHFQWLARTFWIGSAVIVPIAVIIAALLILMFTDIASITTALDRSDPDALMNSIQDYMVNNMTKVTGIAMISMMPTAIWWLRRCWIGYVLARDGKPVKNVMTWF